MSFPYKNPITGQQSDGPISITRNAVQGTNFSVLGVGGYMEVYNLSELNLVFSGTGTQELSGNTVPIQLTIGTNNTFNPTLLTLNSDNISSGRRRLGMLVYVISENQVYQYTIQNYETLWNSVTGQTNVVNISDYTTTVNSRSQEGRDFISAWTASTIDGVDGNTSSNSRWVKYYGSGLSITGGTYNTGNTTLTLVNITGGTVEITGFTISTSGQTGTSGTSGTSGSSGTSGTSGTGFAVQDSALTRVLTSDGTSYGAIAQSGLTYNGDQLTVSGNSIIYGNQYVHSTGETSVTSGTTIISTIPTSSGSSANFDYVIKNDSGYMRAGIVMVVWDTTNTAYTDYSTTDLNGSTSSFIWNVDVDSGLVRLKSVVSLGTWTVNVGNRIIF